MILWITYFWLEMWTDCAGENKPSAFIKTFKLLCTVKLVSHSVSQLVS